MKRRNINLNKIPIIPNIKSWTDVEIRECGENIVPLSELLPERILIEPKYFLLGIEGSMKESFVRETIVEMLLKALNLLPANYKFVIWDAWRSIETQRLIFNSYKGKIRDEDPTLTEEELVNIVQKYVSLPYLDETCPPPHCTGGAVDLSIVVNSGNYVDMGTSYDDFSNKACTRYFEEKMEKGEFLSDDEMAILNNRRLLFHTLTEVGFTNYSEEWWHYDYGNQFWAKSKGTNAFYGGIELKDLNKKI